MVMGISRVVVASPDAAATAAAWERLGVALPVEVRTATDDEPAGLVEIGLAVPDVEATARLLARRGLLVDADLVTIAGSRWCLIEDSENPPAADGLALDHLVVTAADATRAVADYGARLGLDLRLDRDTDFGFRGLFFRCGHAVVEVTVSSGAAQRSDTFAGLAWRCRDLAAERTRLLASGTQMSEIRVGRKPGTVVATVRAPDLQVPTLLIGPAD